ncbi:MAG: ATP-binding cassette domain-containing protein, partial [Muribaculaceae bacterium]|nr:ATP-binding cassette domain-containing protein [Muribaculaceae bacterium]
MSALLEIKGLTQHYGDYAALDHVNLDVESGAVFGLLGPNGAGKTTLLRIINSILVKDEGSVSIDGREACLDVTSKLIGYMPEERGLYGKMRVDEQIMYFGRLRGASKEVLMKNMHEYMGIFNISDNDRHRKVEELSKGNPQKVQIISTLVHDPKL